jgi:hypothetical protein
MPEKSDAAGRILLAGAVLAFLALGVFQAVWALKTKRTLDDVQASLARIDKVEQQVEETVDKFAADQSFLVDDVQRLGKKMDDLKTAFEGRDRVGLTDAPEPPQIDWTQPQLFETAKNSCAEYGIELTKDEVRVPSRFVLKQGAIEYFAVLKGGKEHETLISILGNVPAGERRPKDFAARLNNAVMAIGFKRGKPVRFTPTGRVAPSGDTAYLFVEWEEKGEKVLARAEDLIWDRVKDAPMERGKWVYVGSTFVQGDDPNVPVFAADVTAEVVATYTQSPDTMFDESTAEAPDDSAYLVASPRIPPDVEKCVLVIRHVDREPTRTFPDPPRDADPQPKPSGADDGKPR